MSSAVIEIIEVLSLKIRLGLLRPEQKEEVFKLSAQLYSDSYQAVLDAGGRNTLTPETLAIYWPQGPMMTMVQCKAYDKQQGLAATAKDIGISITVLAELVPMHQGPLLVGAII